MSPLVLAITAAALLLPLSGAAEVIEELTHDTYRVTHAPGRSLTASIDAASPIREEGGVFHGHTYWRIDWQFRWNRSEAGQCAITSTKTTIGLTVTTPLLITADPSTRTTFEKYRERLLIHEDGHVRIARDTAHAIDRSIRMLASQPDCRQLEIAANNLGHRLLEEGNQKNRDYDRATGHGRTQGAWLP